MVLRSDRSSLHPNSSIKVGVTNTRWTISAQELHMEQKEGSKIKGKIIAVKRLGKGHDQKQSA